MSMYTGTFGELLFANTADYTALASFTAEASLLQGVVAQPRIPAGFFTAPGNGYGKSLVLMASGIVSTTATPTFTFSWRFNAAAGATDITGTAVGVSAAITTGSGITNRRWEALLRITCNVPGVGSGNMTANCDGYVFSDGFASPFIYPLLPTLPPTPTWTVALRGDADYYPMLSVACSASSASNTIRAKRLWVYGEN